MKTIKVRQFELNEKTQRFTEPKELKRLRFVIQDSKKVIQSFTGMEPFAFMYLWKTLKRNQFVLVFDDETERMFGYISKNENGIPQRYIEPEELYFSDMYSRVAD